MSSETGESELDALYTLVTQLVNQISVALDNAVRSLSDVTNQSAQLRDSVQQLKVKFDTILKSTMNVGGHRRFGAAPANVPIVSTEQSLLEAFAELKQLKAEIAATQKNIYDYKEKETSLTNTFNTRKGDVKKAFIDSILAKYDASSVSYDCDDTTKTCTMGITFQK